MIFNVLKLLLIGWLPLQRSVPSKQFILFALDESQGVGNIVTKLVEYLCFEVMLWGSKKEADFAGMFQDFIEESELVFFILAEEGRVL